ncbi:MAG: protein kinase, partial [Myxococcota bacterium]
KPRDGLRYGHRLWIDSETMMPLRMQMIGRSNVVEAAVHAAGIIHRDIKPENIFLHRLPDGREQTKLLDFGIARDPRYPSATRNDVGLGTPFYMSPEQATNARAVTAASDVWSVGVILYWLIGGQLPFIADTPFNTLTLVCTATPAKIVVPNADETIRGLLRLINDLLQKSPERRPPNAAAVLRRMDAILGPRTAVESAQRGTALPPSPLALAVSPTLEVGRTQESKDDLLGLGVSSRSSSRTEGQFRRAFAVVAVVGATAGTAAFMGLRARNEATKPPPPAQTAAVAADKSATVVVPNESSAEAPDPSLANPSPTPAVATPSHPPKQSARRASRRARERRTRRRRRPAPSEAAESSIKTSRPDVDTSRKARRSSPGETIAPVAEAIHPTIETNEPATGAVEANDASVASPMVPSPTATARNPRPSESRPAKSHSSEPRSPELGRPGKPSNTVEERPRQKKEQRFLTF